MNPDLLQEIILEDAHAAGMHEDDLTNSKEVMFEAPQALMLERNSTEGNSFLVRHHASQRGFVSVLLATASGDILFQEEKKCRRGENEINLCFAQNPGEYMLYLLSEGTVRSTRLVLQ